jgi:hypothetical protein
MFAKSYFAARYFAPSYWPPVGDIIIVTPDDFPYPIYRRSRR